MLMLMSSVASIDRQRLLECAQEGHACLADCSDAVCPFDNHGEFITAEPCGESRGRHFLQTVGHALQHTVAVPMADAVVEVLEVVEIEEVDADARFSASALRSAVVSCAKS